MQKKTRTQLVIGIVLAGILLLISGGVGYFVVKSRRQVRLFRDAVMAYDDKDYTRAQGLFIQVLRQDKNNEIATVKLAEIAELNGNWLNAMYYRGQARKLNELQPAYAEAYLRVLRLGRYFGLINTYFKNLKQELTPDEQALSFYCKLSLGYNADTIAEWLKFVEANPEVLQSPYGKLVKACFFSRQETIGDVLKVLDELAGMEDKAIAQEALVARANLERMFKRPDEEEKALKAAAEINYFTLAPKLGDFYSHRGRFDEAIEVMVPYLQRHYNSSMILYVGEFMVLGQKSDRLGELVEIIEKHRDRKSIVAGYYMEALKSFCGQNYAKLADSLRVTQNDINTPLSNLMTLVVDTFKNDTAKLALDYAAFQKLPRFRDFPERASALVLMYIDERIMAGESMESLLGLIQLAGEDKQGYKTAALASVDLVSKIQKGTLLESDLQEKLKQYGDSYNIIMAAVSYYYFKGNYEKALEYYDKLKTLNEPISLFIQQQAIDSLIHLKRFNEASAMFKELLLINPAEDNVRAFWRYITINNDKDGMQFLVELPAKLETMPVPPPPALPVKETKETTNEKSAEDAQNKPAEPTPAQLEMARIKWQKQIENVKTYLPYCEAALLLADKKTDEGLDKLEKLKSTNNDLLNYAGYKLAQGKRYEAALAIYKSISSDFKEYLFVLLNISNLLTELNRPEEALEVAKDAWKREPTAVSTIECYALKLKNRNDWSTVLEIVKPASFGLGETADIQKIWEWAVTESMKSHFDKGELTVAKSDALLLQRFDRNNAMAQDYLKRIEELQKEKEGQKKEK